MCHLSGKSIAGWHLVVFPSYTSCTGKKHPDNDAAKVAVI